MRVSINKKKVQISILILALVFPACMFDSAYFQDINFKRIYKLEIQNRGKAKVDTLWTDSTKNYSLIFMLIWDEYDFYLVNNDTVGLRMKFSGDLNKYDPKRIINDTLNFYNEPYGIADRWILINGKDY